MERYDSSIRYNSESSRSLFAASSSKRGRGRLYRCFYYRNRCRLADTFVFTSEIILVYGRILIRFLWKNSGNASDINVDLQKIQVHKSVSGCSLDIFLRLSCWLQADVKKPYTWYVRLFSASHNFQIFTSCRGKIYIVSHKDFFLIF